MNAINRSFN